MNQPNEQPADAGGQAAGSRSNQRNKIIAQVEKYLKYGFNVIPCWPRTKNPAIKHWKEYQGRLATEEERAEWFSEKRNVAILTGPISKIFVLDTDVKKHPEAVEFLQDKHLPDTLKNHTHTGIQYIFTYPGDLEVPNIVALGGVLGIDIGGKGGYIMVYPSIHPEGTLYKWERPKEGELIKDAPEWLLDAIAFHKQNRKEDHDKYDYKRAFDEIPDGIRNNTLTSLGGKLKASGFSVQEALIMLQSVNQTTCKPPLSEEEVESIIKSVFSYENGEGIRLIRLSEITEPTKREWFLDSLIPKNYSTTIYADGGLGKSFFSLLIATQAAIGDQTFLGRRFLKEPLICLYLDWELELDEISRRAYDIARGLEFTKPPEGLLYYTPKSSLYRFLKELPKLVERENIRFLVIDSLGAACVDPDKVTDVVEVFTELRNLNVTSLIVDHQSKMQSQDRYDLKTPFGSVYKFNLSRSVFQLSRLTDSKNPSQLQLKHRKSNFGMLSDALKFDIHFQGDRVLFTESKAPSPEQGEFKIIWEGMWELKEQGKRVNQAELIKHLKGRLSENKIRDRLKDEEGKMFWNAKPGEKNEILYNPRMVEW